MDVVSGTASSRKLPRRGQSLAPRRPLCAIAWLCLALTLPASQTAYAVDIYYARAIGQEYLLEPAAPASPAPNSSTEKPLPELPGLGARAVDSAPPKQEMSLWSKVLIGTVLVAAIAALGNNGGSGSAGVTVGTGDTSAPDPGGAPSGGGSGDDGGGGGEIDVGIGLGPGANNNRGNDRDGNRGRGRGRDDDDDDD